MSRLSLLLLAPMMLALAACGADRDDASPGTTLAEKVSHEVREEMARENLDLGRGNGLPRAELTPEGELLIAGEAVGLDASQRELAIAYREDMADVAERGAAVGIEAAGIAKDSIDLAISGLLSGEGTAAVEEQAKERAKEIESTAMALCESLPSLYASQQALAAAVPEFAPYAQMDESDIDDCQVNID
ncbi:MAG TPA: hypothetical protein VFY00_02385 [Arenimonas sp.]|nr:hypothetical protein [Arenimonas sp.]